MCTTPHALSMGPQHGNSFMSVASENFGAGTWIFGKFLDPYCTFHISGASSLSTTTV